MNPVLQIVFTAVITSICTGIISMLLFRWKRSQTLPEKIFKEIKEQLDVLQTFHTHWNAPLRMMWRDFEKRKKLNGFKESESEG